MTVVPTPDRAVDTATVLVGAGRSARIAGAPVNVPPSLASTFRSAAGATGEATREYARNDSTPGWEALEDVVGRLHGGTAVAFASGMAACAAVIDLLPVGARIVAPTDCYQGVTAYLADGEAAGRWTVQRVDVTDTAAVIAACAGADLLWLESPTNPLLDVADLPVLCPAATGAGALVAVDNTFATPLLQQPLALGADIAVESLTKLMSGHSDVLLGAAVARDPGLARRLDTRRRLGGAVPGSMEAFLALRGLRTLGVRLARAQDSAAELAGRLAGHPAVVRVRYPGMGTVVSFDTGSADRADRVCAAMQVVIAATSLGGVETTIERRSRWAGQEHVPPGLLRMSVGLEAVADLWTDLDRALRDAG